ncbi:hypothetical protein HDU92_003040 [Lobulomyces angularis]|nr:hypothetical protein HDU92_003040 [Lobulomyces angularis]
MGIDYAINDLPPFIPFDKASGDYENAWFEFFFHFFACIGNVLLGVSIIILKDFSPCNLTLLTYSISDFLIGLILLALPLNNLIYGGVSLSQFSCTFISATTVFSCFVSLSCCLALTFERYNLVVWKRNVTKESFYAYIIIVIPESTNELEHIVASDQENMIPCEILRHYKKYSVSVHKQGTPGSSHPDGSPKSGLQQKTIMFQLKVFIATGVITMLALYIISDTHEKYAGTLGLFPIPNDVSIVFVVNSPGVDSNSKCLDVAKEFGFEYLSVNDILNTEQNNPDSDYAEVINAYKSKGLNVPTDVLIILLHRLLNFSYSRKFLIDGFPRNLEEALKFENEVLKSKLIVHFSCPEEERLKEFLIKESKNGKKSTVMESFKKKLKEYKDTTSPLFEHYTKLNKLEQFSCNQSKDEFKNEIAEVFKTLE